MPPTPPARPPLDGLPLFATLSPEQRAAVFAPDPQLVVLAGAGAGKTRVLVARIAHLLWGEPSLPPEAVLAVTFTRKACGEIKARLDQARRWLGQPDEPLPPVDTFHAAALKIVRQAHHPAPRIVGDEVEAVGLLRAFAEGDPWLRRRAIHPERLAGALAARGAGVLTRREREAVTTRFRRWKLDRGLVALDDLIPLALEALADPAMRARHHRRIRALLVDEFQDVDDGQMALFEALVGPQTTFSLFGDDDQAIYRWRGSNPECLRALARRPGVRVVVLPTNYRSCPPILAAADAVIRADKERLDKPVVPARTGGGPPRCIVGGDVARLLGEEVRAQLRRGRAPGDLCVLVRDHTDGRAALRAIEAAGAKAVAAEGERLDPNAVTVQTFHASKGLEYPVVLLPFLEKGRFPGTRRLRRDRENLTFELEEARRAHHALRRLRRERRRALTQLYWILQSVCLPEVRWQQPPDRLGRVVRRLVLGFDAAWRWVWRRDLARTLDVRERQVQAAGAGIPAAWSRAWRRPALEEAAAAWGAEARQTLAEERRLCYVALTRAKDEVVVLASHKEKLSPFVTELPAGVVVVEAGAPGPARRGAP